MAVVGAAQILVRPSFTGFQTAARKQMPSFGATAGNAYAGGFSKQAQRATRETFGQKAANGLKTTAKITGTAVGGILAFALTKGFSRLNSIEQAQAKLRGLGHDAKSIQGIMTSALASVKGTAFGLDEAATAAASAVAAGIKPGKELTRYLKLTADAATIAGTSFKDMGTIINQVTTAGRAQTDDLNQLADRGIPIYQWLAKEYGVTAIKLREMVTKGKVDSATFRKVIEENIGGAALATGDTTQGAFKNMQASLGRIGANLLSGIFPKLREAFVSITKALGPFEDRAKTVGAAIGTIIGKGATGLVGLYDLLVKGDYTGKLLRTFGWAEDSKPIDWLFNLREAVQAVWASFHSRDARSLGDSFGRLGAVIKQLLPAFDQLQIKVPDIQGATEKFAKVVDFASKHTALLKAALGALVTAFLVYKTAQAANTVIGRNSVIGFGIQIGATLALAASNYALAKSHVAVNQSQGVQAATTKRLTVATVAQAVASKAARAASLVWTAVQWGLNAAMYANPIGLVVLAIVGLVAGIILAYKHSETFRRIVSAAWSGIKIAAEATWTFLRDKVWPVILTIFRSIGDAATWLWTKAIKPALDFITGAWSAVGNVFRTVWDGWIYPILDLAGAIIVWLAKKVFAVNVALIRAAWQALGDLIRAVYNKIIKPVIDFFARRIAEFRTAWQIIMKALGQAWTAFAAVNKRIYDTVLKPVIDALGRIIAYLRDRVFKPAMAALQSAWATMSGKIKSVYDKTIGPVIKVLGDKIAGLRKIFSTAVEAIGRAWDGLKAVAKKPVRFVIDVLNSLIGPEDGKGGGFNKLAKQFGTTPMRQIPIPAILKARGGLLPGRSSWRDRDSIPVVARPGEGWTVSEALDDYERRRLLSLNAAALQGVSPAAWRRRNDPGGLSYALAKDKWPVGPAAEVEGVNQNAKPGSRVPVNISGLSPDLRKLAERGPRPGDPSGFGSPVSWGMGQIGHMGWYNRCLAFVNAAWDYTVGRFRLATARQSMNAGPRTMGGRPPAGAGVYWDTGPSGHIALAVGDGSVLSNDIRRAGRIDRVPQGEINKWGPYRGWWHPGGAKGGPGGILGTIIDWFKKMKSTLAGPLNRLKELGTGPLASMLKSIPRLIYDAAVKKAKGWVSGAGGLRGYQSGTMSAQRGWAVVGEQQPELVNFRGREQVAANRRQADVIFGDDGPKEIRGTLDLGDGLVGYVEGIIGATVDRRDTASAHRANLVGVS